MAMTPKGRHFRVQLASGPPMAERGVRFTQSTARLDVHKM